MLYKNWLYTSSIIKTSNCPALKENISTECLIIGGGIAGLHAALRLVNEGKKVVLLEKTICGGSSSGQSAGFLTPQSEEDMSKLIAKHGKDKAKIIHQIPSVGVDLILNNIKKYKFDCDLRKQDSLYLSIKKSHDYKILEEKETCKEMNVPYKMLNQNGLKKYHPGKGYSLGLIYPGTHGINSFAYCQAMKNLLMKKGVKIYEGTEVKKIEKNKAITHLGSAESKNIIVCIDKLNAEFDKSWSKKCYHIQTYIGISEPLSDKEMKSVFPNGELMCWDTKWDYAYYRPVIGNRLLVGASSPWTAYYPKYHFTNKVVLKEINSLKEKFPQIKNINFSHYWSGLIDITKDMSPIVDYDENNKSIQFVMGCAGLNWAAYCGDYAARRILNKNTPDLSEFLGANRKFSFSGIFQLIFGKRISFMLSHLKELLT